IADQQDSGTAEFEEPVVETPVQEERQIPHAPAAPVRSTLVDDAESKRQAAIAGRRKAEDDEKRQREQPHAAAAEQVEEQEPSAAVEAPVAHKPVSTAKPVTAEQVDGKIDDKTLKKKVRP